MTQADSLTRMAVVKHRTKDAHLETEKIFIPKLKTIHSEEGYVHVLKMFYGFYSPLYHSIFRFISKQVLPDIEKRRTPEWIIQDLAAIKGDASDISICANLPEITNCAQALGALYVLEGSTLGGAIIVQMLKKNKHLSLPENSFSFFAAYGEANSSMWQSFGACFEETIATEDALQQAIGAANETFKKLKWWMLNYN